MTWTKGVLIASYIACMLLDAMWNDAMDRRYGLNGDLPKSWLSTTFAASLWPVSLPLSLGMMVTDDGGRWRLAAR